MDTVRDRFDLSGRVALITGGAGLLGVKHAEAIAAAGGTPGLVDIATDTAEKEAARLSETFGVPAFACSADITQPEQVRDALATALDRNGRVDILINNAAHDPKVGTDAEPALSRLEHLPLEPWRDDLAVAPTGLLL